MTPANITFRQKSRRRFVAPAIIGVLVVAAVLIYIGKSGSSRTGKKEQPKTPQVAFTLSGYQVFSEGKDVSGAAAGSERSAIVSMLTDFYETAFVDPKKWSDPKFGSLTADFTGDAQISFEKDVNSLTIGEGRDDFSRVDPTAAVMRLSLYYDAGGKPQLAIAAVHFAANATTKSKRRVDVLQDATFRLQKSGGGWQIFSYQASSRQDTPSPSPSPSAT